MTRDTGRCVVVGSGHAAAQLCVALVQEKWPGKISVVGDDPHPPYHRPPLSKTFLDPQKAEPLQLIRPETFYADHGIELCTGERATAIDRQTKRLQLEDRTVSYDQLVLATGSQHRRPPIPGIENSRVFTLQTAAQAEAIRHRVRDAESAIVIGAGFIGLEVAAALRNLGLRVVVFECAERVLARVTSPVVSHFFAALHRDHGVDLHTSAAVTEIDDRNGRLVATIDGTDQLEADFAVVGVGAMPNDQLARDAGLAVDNGIVVDAYNRTSDPSIFAIGDCCNQYSPLYDKRLRLESVQNAGDQAKIAAAAIHGLQREHNALPWFWSDQYDVKLQIAGISTGYDECLIRGTPEPGNSFSAWYLKSNRLLAVDAINDARAYAVASKLIPARRCPDRALVLDANCDAKSLLSSAVEV